MRRSFGGAAFGLVFVVGCASPESGLDAVTGVAGDVGETGSAPETGGAGENPGEAPIHTHPPAKSKPAHVVGGFAIDLPAETLSPGEERGACYIFPLEIEGPSRVVGGGKLTVGAGLHHGNIVTRPKTGEGFRPCPKGDSAGALGGEVTAVFEGGAVLFGSSTQIAGEEWQRFPDGMGFSVKEGQEVVAHMHYLNTSGEAFEVAPHYEWFTVDEGSVEHLVAPFAWALRGWQIPPKSDFTATGSCKMMGPMHLVHALPHMHRMGHALRAELRGGPFDGARFLDSKGYDPESGVMVEYDPSLDLSIADGFDFSCEWHNTLDKTLVEGVGDDEMCVLFGYAYPIENAYSAVSTGGDSCLLVAPNTP